MMRIWNDELPAAMANGSFVPVVGPKSTTLSLGRTRWGRRANTHK